MQRPNALPTGRWADLPLDDDRKLASGWGYKSPSPETVWRPGAGMSSNSATMPASAPALGDGEHLLRPATQMIAVEASTGIGAGLIDRGTLLRGMKGTAGAMGHIHIQRGVDFQCLCGNKGRLVALSEGWAIAKSLTADGFKADNVDDVVEPPRGMQGGSHTLPEAWQRSRLDHSCMCRSDLVTRRREIPSPTKR